MPLRPRIGITSGLASPRWALNGQTWRAYADAVEAAGGQPVHLSEDTRGRELAVLKGLDGLVLTGGRDIDLACYPTPPEYPGETHAEVMARHRMEPEPERDSYELPLFLAALQRDVPIFGICRGCQVIQVGMGGQLVLDIPTEVQSPLRHAAWPEPDPRSSFHAIHVEVRSILSESLGPAPHFECNSRHHQAVRPGTGIGVRVTAVSPVDGIVEAIEVPGRRWVLGVQWHPEHPGDPHVRDRHSPLFKAFVRAAS